MSLAEPRKQSLSLLRCRATIVRLHLRSAQTGVAEGQSRAKNLGSSGTVKGLIALAVWKNRQFKRLVAGRAQGNHSDPQAGLGFSRPTL